jgi:hypothetical protein
VIAKQRGWYRRRGTAMNGKLARRQARSQRSINSLANAFGKHAREYAIAAKAL